MKKFFKIFVIGIFCITLNATPVNAAFWCIYDFLMFLLCTIPSIDMDSSNAATSAAVAAKDSQEAISQKGNEILTNDYKESMSGEGEVSAAPVPNYNLSNPPEEIDSFSTVVQDKGDISISENDTVSINTTQNTLAKKLLELFFVKHGNTVISEETSAKARETFFVVGIFEALSEAYNASVALDELAVISERIAQDSQNDNSFNDNLRFKQSIDNLRINMMLKLNELRIARTQLEIREAMYLSPNLVADQQAQLSQAVDFK